MSGSDGSSKGVRFGCGFILGVVGVGLSLTVFLWAQGWYAVAMLVAAGCICGALAVRYGDDFFEKYIKSAWWWQ